MIFNTFCGNNKAKQTLAWFFNSGRFPHAVMFEGSAGCGKKTLAKLCAAALLCEKNETDEKPCHTCKACTKIFSCNHPDVFMNDETTGSKSFHIDVIREIRKDIFIRPNDGDRKIYILTNTQNMTVSAQNSLLKILEEPPSYAVFLLTCDNRHAMLETILSRVVTIPVFAVSAQECKEYLSTNYSNKSLEQIEYAVKKSGGNIGEAIKIIEQSDEAVSKSSYELSSSLVRSFVENKEFDLLSQLSVFEKDKELFRNCLGKTLVLLRDCLMYKSGSANLAVSDNETAAYISARLTTLQTIALINIISQTLRNIEQNANNSLLVSWFASEIKNVVF